MEFLTIIKIKVMRKMLLAMVAVMLLCCCTKEELADVVEPLQESVVYINLNEQLLSRATGAGHGIQGDDNTINVLEIFIFRVNHGEADDGVLDGYRKFSAQELGNLTSLEVQTTTGKKMIYAVANAHRANWQGINTRALFERQTALLEKDGLKDFTMIGGKEAELGLASTVAFSISRLVSRVQIVSLKTAFAGGPYDGMPLKSVKAYLTNVQGEKYIFNGEGNNLKILNQKRYIETDAALCNMEGMLYDDFGTDISGEEYTAVHSFYCYANDIEEEKDGNKFTRVVIEGVLNGITYYYPIALPELKSNTCYSLDITIKRPGSPDPDSDIEKGTLLASVNVLDWDVTDDNIVEF